MEWNGAWRERWLHTREVRQRKECCFVFGAVQQNVVVMQFTSKGIGTS